MTNDRYRFSSAPLHVVEAGGDMDRQSLHLLGQPDLAGQARSAGDVGGEIEHVLLLLAGAGKLREILGGDDDMAGRAGHLPLARPLERLARILGDIEQPRTRRGKHLALLIAVGGDEADQGHAANLSWRSAASSIRPSAVRSS